MLSLETLKKDFDRATTVWGDSPTVGGVQVPGFVASRTEIVDTEEGVVERHYKVLVTTSALAPKTSVTHEGTVYETTGAPAREGVYEYRLREVKD